MSKYAIYRMFDGCDAPYNVEFCGHLVGSRIWTGDDNPTALMASERIRLNDDTCEHWGREEDEHEFQRLLDILGVTDHGEC